MIHLFAVRELGVGPPKLEHQRQCKAPDLQRSLQQHRRFSSAQAVNRRHDDGPGCTCSSITDQDRLLTAASNVGMTVTVRVKTTHENLGSIGQRGSQCAMHSDNSVIA